MNALDVESLLKVITPIGLAIAWIWAQIRLSDKEEHNQQLEIEERERAYSKRVEERLEKAQKELENALQVLKTQQNAEEVLKTVVASDPGIMFIKKRIGARQYEYLKVSRGYAIMYLGGPSELIEGKNEAILGLDFSENDEFVYRSQVGHMFKEPISSPFTNVKGLFVGRKFPVTTQGNTYIIGVGDHEYNKET